MFECNVSKSNPDPWTRAMAEIGIILNRYGYRGQAGPGLKGPTHMTPGSLAGAVPAQQAMAEIGEVLSRLSGLGLGIGAPPRVGPVFQAQDLMPDLQRQALSEMAGVLSRYGLMPGVREPAHKVPGESNFDAQQDPWKQVVSELAGVLSRSGLSGQIGPGIRGPAHVVPVTFGPLSDPFKQALTEAGDVMSRYGISRQATSGMCQPPAMVPGVREPAHMMPGHSGIPAELGRQIISEITGRLNQYSPYALSMPQIMGELESVLSKLGPQPEPWVQAALSEIAQRLSGYGNQPVPASQAISEIESTLARLMMGPGIGEPEHMGPFNAGSFR